MNMGFSKIKYRKGAYSMPGDLHTHSTFSDGSIQAEMLPIMASRMGMTYLSIADHDTMHSVRYAYEYPFQHGVSLIPCTELTAYDFKNDCRIHMLCYWPDLNCPELAAHCQLMADRRNKVCRQSAKELEEIFPYFKAEDAIKLAAGGVLYKSTIMRVLCEYGLADGIYNETYKSLFSRSSGRVLHNPEYQSIDEVLELIKKARGVAVFAHPSVYKSMQAVRELVAQGRIDGIEVEHPRNTEEDKAELRQLALDNDLIITGGTDFHGLNSNVPRPLGMCQTPDDQIRRIAELARSRKV